jgi:hypothetical protein
VCRFRIVASKQSLDEVLYINCLKLSQTSKYHLQSFVSPLQERLNLGFLTEGKLAALLIIPSSWGSQRAGHSPRIRTVCYTSTWHQQLLFWCRCRGSKKNNLPRQLGTIKRISFFSAAVAGEEVEDLCEGSFSHAHPLLCYCFALLFLFYLHHFISKTQKN